jgi:hypothetical protein
MSYMLNSQNEKIEIRTVLEGDFKGMKVLILHCEVTGVRAPHLLDESTVDFLLKQLDSINV